MRGIATTVDNQANTYGIHVEDVKIKRFDLPESNLNAVYSRMISERNQMAEKIHRRRQYEASIIRNNVDKQVNILISDAKGPKPPSWRPTARRAYAPAGRGL